MTDEKGNNPFWNEWQDILLAEFESRLTAIGSKGNRGALVRKNFSVLFLQDKGFKVPAADVIQEAIRIISGREENGNVKGIV